MRKFNWLFVTLLMAGLLFAKIARSEDEDYNDDEPDDDEDDGVGNDVAMILSPPQNFTLPAGATANLPCKVDKEDSAVLQWTKERKESNLPLFFDGISQVTDNRFAVLPNNTLVIKNLDRKDQGMYTCQTLSGNVQAVKHHVFVESPAEIVMTIPNVRDEGTHVATKGRPLTIACTANGHPTPTITWTHQSKHDGERVIPRDTISIDELSNKDAGKYTCKAMNSNGEARKTFTLVVESLPEIKTENDIVNTAERYESEMMCTVEAYPPAEVSWFKDGNLLTGPAHHIFTAKEGNNHFLRISTTKISDFGDYECKARNSLGEATKKIVLSGNPSKPKVKLADHKNDDRGSPFLVWELQSKAIITEYELLYKRQENSNWTSVAPSTTKNSGTEFVVEYLFEDLKPGTYQAKLKAKNTYGWSPFSDAYSFAGVSEPVKGEKPRESRLLEQPKFNSASQVRISLAFILSLLIARLLR